MRLALCCVLPLYAALSACTPIAPARSAVKQDNETADASAEDAASPAKREPDAGQPEAPDASKPDLNTAEETPKKPDCNQPGARKCGPGNPSRQPLECVDGEWQSVTECNEGQRCETAEGPEQGKCVKIAKECIGRTPDEQFCDGQLIRSCNGGVSKERKRCGELQRCSERNNEVACQCASGTVDKDGKCQVALSCDQASGGCDPLTTCSMNGDTRECGACPEGFSGDGLSGCVPQLLGLAPMQATLVPSFASEMRAYKIRVPMFFGLLTLQPRAANGVKIEINGTEVAKDASWSSGALPFGELTLIVDLTAPTGLTSRYEVVVQRDGAQEAFIKAMHPEKNDTFGMSVAISGDTLAVGATSEDGDVGGVNGDETNNAAAESGAVYVFVRQGTSWTQQAYLKAADPQEGNYFGGGLALDGDTLLVSETRANPYPNDEEDAPERPGIVHVFTRNAGVWSETTSIASPSGEADLFGYAMAMSSDTVVIGAPYDAALGRNAGAVYSVARDGNWGPLSKLTARNGKADEVFGWSLALDKDGLLVGAPEKSLQTERSGKAFYFARNAGSWQQQAELSAPMPETGGTFGWSVALQGDLAAIGSPRASLLRRTPRGQTFVFERADTGWALTKALQAVVPRDSDYFGSSVAFARDNLLIAASGDASGVRGLNGDPSSSALSQSGAFYLFQHQGDDWLRTAFIKADNAAASAGLGQAAAISGDSIVLGAIGEATAASGSGAVYVFR